MDPDYANYEVQFKYACRLPSFTLFKMGSFMFRPTTFKKKKNDRKCLFHYRNSSFICTCNVLKIIFTWDGKANQNKRYGKFHFPYDLAFHLPLLPKKTYIGFYQLFIQNSTWTNTNYYLNIRRTSNKNTSFIKITFWKHVPNEINLRHSYHFNNFLSFDWPTSAKVTRIFRYFFRKERAINVCNWNKSPKSSIEILRLYLRTFPYERILYRNRAFSTYAKLSEKLPSR